MKTLLLVFSTAACVLMAFGAFANEPVDEPVAEITIDVPTAEWLLDQGQVTPEQAVQLREFIRSEQMVMGSPGQPSLQPSQSRSLLPLPQGHCVIASGLCRPLNVESLTK